MNITATVDYDALNWVKGELDAQLNQVRLALEAAIEDPGAQDRLHEARGLLHQVYGTLQMVELYGAAMLAEEMEEVAESLADDALRRKEEAYEALSKAIIQLPDYLEHIQAGHIDSPILLLPYLNDLRAVRDVSLLSENLLFFPDVLASPVCKPEHAVQDETQARDAQPLARNFRHAFQLGLLGLINEKDLATSFRRLDTVLQRLLNASRTDPSWRLWWICGAYVEALTSSGLELNVAAKSLLGKVDRQIRALSEKGEESFFDKSSEDLLRNLLYYIATAKSEGQQVEAVKDAYRLRELLPQSQDLQAARERIAGPNLALLTTVGDAIRDDLAEVKETLEIFNQSGAAHSDELKSLAPKLQKIADTLGMLGLGASREQVLSTVRIIGQLTDGDQGATENALMRMAGELLSVETALNSLVVAGVPSSDVESIDAAAPPTDSGQSLPESEYRGILSAVIREALVDMSKAKDAILDFVSTPESFHQLAGVSDHLASVKGALLMLPLEKPIAVMDGIKQYVCTLMEGRRQPDQSELDALADAITSVEFYLESLSSRSVNQESILEVGVASVQKLGVFVAEPGDSAPTPEAGDAQDEVPESAEVSKGEHESAVEVPPQAAVAGADEPLDEAVPETHEENVQTVESDAAGREAQSQALQPLTGELDEEILEIFLEEAQEESDRLCTLLPQWQSNPSDEEALTTIRRSFHTLKGSGRLVGAQAIGELSWSLENLLNRVINDTVEVNEQLLMCVGKAVRTLPQLIGQVKGEAEPDQDVRILISEANALSAPQHGRAPDHASAGVEDEAIASRGEVAPRDRSSKSEERVAQPSRGADATTEQDERPQPIPGDDVSAALTSPGVGAHGDTPPAVWEDQQPAADAAGTDHEPEGDEAMGGPVPRTPRPVDTEPEVIESKASEPEQAVQDEPDLPGEQDAELVEIFLEEAREILDSSDNAVQRWRDRLDDAEVVTELQRYLHTLKGGARMAGFKNVGNLSHAVEALVLAVVEGQLAPDQTLFSALLAALDRLNSMIDLAGEMQPIHEARDLIEQLSALRGQDASKDAPDERSSQGAQALADSGDHGVSIEAVFEQGIDGSEELVIEPAGESTGVFDANDESEPASEFSDADSLADVAATIHEPAGESTASPSSNKALAQGSVASAHPEQSAVGPSDPGLGESDQSQSAVSPSAESRQSVARAPAPSAPPAVTPRPDLGQKKKTLNTERSGAQTKSAGPQELIRVRADLVDQLVNNAGEVNIYHSRLQQHVSGFGFNLVELEQTITRLRDQLRNLELETEAQILFRYEKEKEQHAQENEFDPLEMDRYSNIQQLSRALAESVNDLVSIQDLLAEQVRDTETLILQQSRVSTELQEGLMRTRMVQFGGIGPRLRRIARQTATELGKEVDLTIRGEDSELDRSLLERMIAPLEHLLRNAISHGIETPVVRKEQGKSERGLVEVTVEREGSEIVIRVNDDGAGINVSAIREKVNAMGWLGDADAPPDSEIMQYILQPGFSTAQEVTQISGRGVGMDVVHSEIKKLGGVLSIDSERAKGTVFTVRLPFTLAINQALLVQSGQDLFAVTMASIEGVVRLSGAELLAKYDERDPEIEHAGACYQLKSLAGLLGMPELVLEDTQTLRPVVLIYSGDQRVALQVDLVIGSREVVVKPLGPQLSSVSGISGATILGDGRVVLILDVLGLVRKGAGVPVLYRSSEPESTTTVDRPLTVMVVDDSITIRKVTARVLQRNNYNVMTAKDGVDAVGQLAEAVPDLMLLDIEMPRMDGFELAMHVRSDERLQDVPIVMITSRTGEKHRQRAMDIGVNRYLGKPYQESELLELITELLQSE